MKLLQYDAKTVLFERIRRFLHVTIMYSIDETESGIMDWEVNVMNNPTIEDALISREAREQFIKDHMGFIIHTTSEHIGRYLSIENDEAYSVALEAFNHAIETYDSSISKFETYATTVIRNRLTDAYRKTKRGVQTVALDEQMVEQLRAPEPDDELRMEIAEFKTLLAKFGLTFESLVESSPKHKDSRDKAIGIGTECAGYETIVKALFKHLKLPVKEILGTIKTTRRFLYLHRVFITAVILVFSQDFTKMRQWILETFNKR